MFTLLANTTREISCDSDLLTGDYWGMYQDGSTLYWLSDAGLTNGYTLLDMTH